MADPWRTFAVILTLAGLVIPIAAVLVALRRVRRQVGVLETNYDKVKALLHDQSGTDADKASRKAQAQRIMTPTATYTDAMYLHENIQIHLRHAEWGQLTWPAVWAGIGLLCSTVGSVIGFYLPAG